MDKYLQLQCVKGLLMSLDDQLFQRSQKYGDNENLSVRKVIVDKYYDSVLEQLPAPEDQPIVKDVIINGGVQQIKTETLTYEQIISLALGEVFDDRIYSITCSTKSTSFTVSKDMDIAIEEGMVINVADTSKA